MTKKGSWIAVLAICLLGSYLAMASPQAGGGAQGAGGGRGGAAPPPPQPMSFFVASQGSGKGADLGGLAGADAICQRLAASTGRGGVTWHAYMSTQGAGGVNARDRIGNGPWYNQKGQLIARNLSELHGDTLEQARLGNGIAKTSDLTEKGEIVNGVGDQPNRHDMLTGSTPEGKAFTEGEHTCKNYTSSADEQGVTVQLGHADRQGAGNNSWNSAHTSAGCSQPALVRTGGAGLFYCFAVN
jgi:hypothetical protein